MSTTPNSTANGGRGNGIPRVIVATTALLTFISFWRAAAIVLNDLASSAYYAGGEAEGELQPVDIAAIQFGQAAVARAGVVLRGHAPLAVLGRRGGLGLWLRMRRRASQHASQR